MGAGGGGEGGDNNQHRVHKYMYKPIRSMYQSPPKSDWQTFIL